MKDNLEINLKVLSWATLALILTYAAAYRFSQTLTAGFLGPVAKGLLMIPAFALIFFLPGGIYSAGIFRPLRAGAVVVLFSAVVIQYYSLLIATTIAKLLGWVVTPPVFIAAELAMLLPALIMYRRSYRVKVGIDFRAPVLISIGVLLAAICSIYGQRLRLTIDDYWLENIIETIRFNDRSHASEDISTYYSRSLDRHQGGVIRIESSRPEIVIRNRGRNVAGYHLLYFIRGRIPSEIKLILNETLVGTYSLPQSFYKNNLHVFGNQCIISERITLDHGDNVIELRFGGAHTDVPFSGDLQNFSGLTKQQFVSAFSKKNGILNIGQMYDIREIFTFGDRLRDKLYLWGDRFSLSQREDYICFAGPAASFQDMYILAAVGNFPMCLHLAFFIRTFILALGIVYLAEKGLQPLRARSIALLLAVMAAYCSVSITCAFDYFPNAFLLMSLFAAIIFLIENMDRLWLLAALMAALSRFQVIEIVLILLLAYCLLTGQRRRMFQLLGRFSLCLLLFASVVFLIGWSNDTLTNWKSDIYWEYFFKSLDEAPSGLTDCDNVRNLLKWTLLTSCLIPIGLKFRGGDTITRLMMITVSIYLGHLLLSAHLKVYRVHYVSLAVVFFLLWILRGWNIDDASGGVRRQAWRIGLLAGAVVTSIYLLIVPFDHPDFNSLSIPLYQWAQRAALWKR